MDPWSEFSDEEARRIQVVFADIDDTITTEGRLGHEAYRALWDLHNHNIAVVLVTGRPAGWCDHIARMWPITGIVGENGAFYFRYDTNKKRLISSYLLDQDARNALQGRLTLLGERILASVSGSALASDQAYRIHDLAIDFCEDVTPLSEADIQRIVHIFESEGATAKISSIHVNGWFGHWDKVSMISQIASEELKLDLKDSHQNTKAIYIGDSPNDEPAFAFFENSVGVANIRNFENQLKHPPRYITRLAGGDGFCELVEKLIQASA
jgi:HAD superfamily hydrolase (TIGR01484 family)